MFYEPLLTPGLLGALDPMEGLTGGGPAFVDFMPGAMPEQMSMLPSARTPADEFQMRIAQAEAQARAIAEAEAQARAIAEAEALAQAQNPQAPVIAASAPEEVYLNPFDAEAYEYNAPPLSQSGRVQEYTPLVAQPVLPEAPPPSQDLLAGAFGGERPALQPLADEFTGGGPAYVEMTPNATPEPAMFAAPPSMPQPSGLGARQDFIDERDMYMGAAPDRFSRMEAEANALANMPQRDPVTGLLLNAQGEQGFQFMTDRGRQAGFGKGNTGFITADPNAQYRMWDERGKNRIVSEGTGVEALQNIYNTANQFNQEQGKKANWGIERLNPTTGQWERIAENDPAGGGVLGVVGDVALGAGVGLLGAATGGLGLAALPAALGGAAIGGGLNAAGVNVTDVALPVAANFLLPGSGFLASAGASALGSAASSALQGRSLEDTLLRAAITGGTAGVLDATGASQALAGALGVGGDVAAQKAAQAAGDILVQETLAPTITAAISGAGSQLASAAPSPAPAPEPATPAVQVDPAGNMVLTAPVTPVDAALPASAIIGAAAGGVAPPIINPDNSMILTGRTPPPAPEVRPLVPPIPIPTPAPAPIVTPEGEMILTGRTPPPAPEVPPLAPPIPIPTPAPAPVVTPEGEMILTGNRPAVESPDRPPLPPLPVGFDPGPIAPALPDMTQTPVDVPNPSDRSLLDEIIRYYTLASGGLDLLGGALGGGGGGAGRMTPYVSQLGPMPTFTRGAFTPFGGDYETYGFGPEFNFFGGAPTPIPSAPAFGLLPPAANPNFGLV
jgi:hypothetical protein